MPFFVYLGIPSANSPDLTKELVNAIIESLDAHTLFEAGPGGAEGHPGEPCGAVGEPTGRGGLGGIGTAWEESALNAGALPAPPRLDLFRRSSPDCCGDFFHLRFPDGLDTAEGL